MTDPRERTIFLAAAELDGSARASYLDEACGGDAALRARVEGLLAADLEAVAERHDQSILVG